MKDNYIISESKNIIIKGDSNAIFQITTVDNEKDLIKKDIYKKNYN